MNDVSFSREDSNFLPVMPRGALETAPESRALPIVTRYYRIALRRKWLIIGSVAVALLIGVLMTLLATPQYAATTRIEISREGTRIVDVADVQPETAAMDLEFYQTQYGILSSRALAERVARDLRLFDNAEFFAMFGETEVLENLEPGRAAGSADERERRTRVAVDVLLDQLSVKPIRLSRLVDVQWTSPSPELSAKVANAWASSFIEYNIERRFEQTAYARKFLEQRLGELRGRLEESERQLVGYASNQAIINIPIGSGEAGARPPERSIIADRLIATNAELAAATADRARAESRLRQASGGAVSEALTNPAIYNLRQRRAEAAAERSRLLTQFEQGYPAIEALAAQIAQLDAAITQEERRVQTSFQHAYQDARQREQAVASRLEGLKQTFIDERRRGIQYNIYQRDADTNRELYEGLLQRYKEIGVAGGVGTNNVAIVDVARVPEQSSYPKPLINLLLALIGGMVVGAGLALLREQIDETITDPSELEAQFGLPLLGAIPLAQQAPMAEMKDAKSNLVEAYLSVHTNLAFSTDHGVPRSLAVTSTRAGEGKSTTAFAIAYSIARTGGRTILIDGDLRSPSVHHNVGIANQAGLSNFLAGTEGIDQLIRQVDGVPFAILSAGPQPPNAAELLRGDRLDALLAELTARFDHVVIDAPPVLGLADAPIIGSRVEGMVYVIEARGVRARMAQHALGRLRQARSRLIGIVLTKFEAKRAHYGYGYDYGYEYGSADDKQSRAAA